MPDPNPLPIIDFHNHYVAADWPVTAGRVGSPEQQARWRRIAGLLADEAALVADIDSGDIQGRVVNSPAALIADPYGAVPAGTIPRLNDRLAELVARHPGKLHGLASIDAFSGEAGAREAHRAIRELGHRGIFVDSAKGGRLLDAPEARPTLAAAHELGVPVFAHPINPDGLSEQLAPYGRLGVFLARGTVNAASLVALLEGGVFDELPNLHVVVTTLAIGGVFLAGGFGDGARIRHDTPAALRRHVTIDSMGLHPALLRGTVDLLGADHVVVGTDWPIVNDEPIRPRLIESFAAAGLTPEEQGQVAGGNALRLLGLAA